MHFFYSGSYVKFPCRACGRDASPVRMQYRRFRAAELEGVVHCGKAAGKRKQDRVCIGVLPIQDVSHLQKAVVAPGIRAAMPHIADVEGSVCQGGGDFLPSLGLAQGVEARIDFMDIQQGIGILHGLVDPRFHVANELLPTYENQIVLPRAEVPLPAPCRVVRNILPGRIPLNFPHHGIGFCCGMHRNPPHRYVHIALV